MVYFGLALVCIAFIELFLLLALPQSARMLLDLSKRSLAVVSSKTLSDEQKEQQIRRASLDVFKATFWFIGKFLLLIVLLYLLQRLLAAVLPYSDEEFWAGMVSAPVVVALTAFAFAYLKLRHVFVQRLRPG